MTIRKPKDGGIYWLALDEGGCFATDRPLLVRVRLLEPYNEARIEFLDFPGVDSQRDFVPTLDGGNGLASIATGTRHTFHHMRRIVELVWISAARAPKLPPVSA